MSTIAAVGLMILSLVLCAFAFSIVASLFRGGAPYVPSKKRNMMRAIKLARIRPQDTAYDIGSGDGRFLFAILRHSACRRVVGIEISGWLALYTSLRIRMAGLSNRARALRGNAFRADLSDADVVFCYLMPEFMTKLRHKLEKELKPGSRVISLAFPVHDWEPDAVDQENRGSIGIYRYTIDKK